MSFLVILAYWCWDEVEHIIWVARIHVGKVLNYVINEVKLGFVTTMGSALGIIVCTSVAPG